MWIGRTALAAAFDMEGAFNDIEAMLAPGANETSVLDAIDRRLEPYGGLIAHGRRDQASHRVLADEIAPNRGEWEIRPGRGECRRGAWSRARPLARRRDGAELHAVLPLPAAGVVATWVPLLAPAEAMRPPAPQAYQQGMLERLPGVRHVSARRLMILRRMTDRSVRSMLTIAGIALAAPIIVMSLF